MEELEFRTDAQIKRDERNKKILSMYQEVKTKKSTQSASSIYSALGKKFKLSATGIRKIIEKSNKVIQ